MHRFVFFFLSSLLFFRCLVDCFLPSFRSFFQTTMSVLAKEVAIIAIFILPALTLLGLLPVLATLDMLEMVSLALITTSA